MIEIPGYGVFEIEHIVCDYNGTIARDGRLLKKAIPLLNELAREYTLHILTADTFGSVKEQIADLDAKLKILSSSNHTAEKEAYILSLGKEKCAAIGNGNNDRSMLKSAAIGVSIVAEEGCSTEALLSSDIVCRDITDALTLFKSRGRLVATLRR